MEKNVYDLDLQFETSRKLDPEHMQKLLRDIMNLLNGCYDDYDFTGGELYPEIVDGKECAPVWLP